MQARSHETRSRILQSAIDLFSKEGYDATGVAEICTAAGVSKGAFYHHFPTKQALFLALLDRMAALHGFQVFLIAFLDRANYYEMGVPAVPLGHLYSAEVWQRYPRVRIHLRAPVAGFDIQNDRVQSLRDGQRADYYISAVPLERLEPLAPGVVDASWLQHSPITGIHLWFDRPVTDLPHATLANEGENLVTVGEDRART